MVYAISTLWSYLDKAPVMSRLSRLNIKINYFLTCGVGVQKKLAFLDLKSKWWSTDYRWENRHPFEGDVFPKFAKALEKLLESTNVSYVH